MRAVRLAALSQQNLARMGVQQARVSFFSLVSCDGAGAVAAVAASTTAGRCSRTVWRGMSQLSAVDADVPTKDATEESRRADIEKFLRLHDIHVKGQSVPAPILSFEESGLPKHLLNLVLSQFPSPTPIQAQAGLAYIFFPVHKYGTVLSVYFWSVHRYGTVLSWWMCYCASNSTAATSLPTFLVVLLFYVSVNLYTI